MANLDESGNPLDATVEALRRKVCIDEILGTSSVMLAVKALVEKFEQEVARVLLLGETGTGKTKVAKVIHYAGARAAKPFVAVNCAAVPAEIMESEMFGCGRGAFTGAVARIGLFEQADGG